MWAQELEWHLLAPLVLFGMTYALLKGEHVRVDVFYARYSPRGKAAVDLARVAAGGRDRGARDPLLDRVRHAVLQHR